MASSLAAQIAQTASLNTALLVDRSRRRPTESYLFTSREAEQHDVDSVHALGVNAFLRLRSVEPALGAYEPALFSDAAKTTDRTLQNAEANAALDKALDSFLPMLGPYLLEATTGKVLEWLVRRFRIQEFNVDAVLSLFLPYHDAPHFTKMLSILYIKTSSKFAPLLPFKSTNTPLTHAALVNIMTQAQNTEFTRFVAGLLPGLLKSSDAVHTLHRALIATHTGVLLEFIRRSFGSKGKAKHTGADEVTLAWLLPAAIEPLQVCADIDVPVSKENVVGEVILSSYLLLSAISHSCGLSSKALNVMLKAIAACAGRVSAKQAARTLASVCAGQDANVVNEKPLPKTVLKVLAQIPTTIEEIQESLSFVGTEKFAIAFGRALIAKLGETTASNMLTSLFGSSSLPRVMVQALTEELVRLYLTVLDADDDGVIRARARALLVTTQQRHPAALQSAFDVVLKGDEDHREAIEQLLLSLSVVAPFQVDNGSDVVMASPSTDPVVASISADAPVRAIAIRQLYERLSDLNLPELERTSIRTALLARVQDSNGVVLEALYASPEIFLALLLQDQDSQTYVSKLAGAMHAHGASLGRTAVKAHLTFVIAHLYPALVNAKRPDTATEVLYKVVFPYLLFSKPKQKTATLVWELIEAHEGAENSVGRSELLAGCVDAVRWEQGKAKTGTTEAMQGESYQNTEMMAKANLALVSRITENIVASAVQDQHFAFILDRLRDTNTHARALAYLICRTLLSHFKDSRLIDAAQRVLDAMDIKTLDGMDEFMRGTDNLQVFLHDLSLSTAVVLKPSKVHTLQRLQVAILSFIPNIPRPDGVMAEWLAMPSATSTTKNNNEQYVSLMRTVYVLANSTSTLPTLSTHLLRSLFVNLGDDALKLLAGIWLHSDPLAPSTPAEFAALRHAAAFLEAHLATQSWVDFQTVLPALLVALQHSDRRVREATLECIDVLCRLSQTTKPNGIYAFDVIYGAGSAELQYIEWSDLCRYIQTLAAAREHLLNDASYLRLLHQQYLTTTKTDSKKEAGYKQRVLCYLLSHVVACPLVALKLALLRTMEEVSSSAKWQMLRPVLEELSTDVGATKMREIYGNHCEEFVAMVVTSFDGTATSQLNKDNELWNLYKAILRQCCGSGDVAPAARASLLQRLQSSIFVHLQKERKQDVCRLVLDLGQQSQVLAQCREFLGAVLTEVQVIVQLLVSIQPGSTDTARAAKRAKLDGDTKDTRALSLTLLLEILGGISLPASVELMTCLLDVLSKVIHDTSAGATDKSYVAQLLMSAIENAATNVESRDGLAQSAIRLDILVELIRSSENPQTFQQALLLMATLARLAPDAVLRNVMPVFTFMGSNVFHRDDAYSFRVVQKTIDSIVPVMVSSLREQHTSPLELNIASRDFLRVFTDAANHIPRHRRTSFFGHLLDVLGPNEFLAPVCMLLVDKLANRVTRQSAEDALASLSLPLATLQRYDRDLQLATIVETLREAQRLLDQVLSGSTQPTFLPVQQDEEGGAQSAHTKRQVSALLTFVTYAVKDLASLPAVAGSSADTELLSVLLDIGVSKAGALATESMTNISQSASVIITDSLLVMPASQFVHSVVIAIESGVSAIQQGSLELLAAQLANVSDKVRQDAKASMAKVIEFSKKALASASVELYDAALHTLRAIATSLSRGEEHALTSTVPAVLKLVKERHSTGLALEVLLAESHKLGPRLIPYFKDMIKECSNVVRTDGQDDVVAQNAVGVLQSLLTSIPNFWSSSEFTQVINLYLDICASSSAQQLARLSPLIKTVSKKAPTKLLLTTLCDMWTSLKTESIAARFEGYFFVMKRVIHVADRAIVSHQLRAVHKIFMDFFEVCSTSPDVKTLVETDAIAAFLELVVKLNETTFRPLFRQFFDWAFASSSDHAADRKLVLCSVYMALIDYFKNLMTPYMSYLLQPFCEVLQQPSDDLVLWQAVLQTLSKTLAHDEKVFWRDDKLQQLLPPLIAQVPTAASHRQSPDAKVALSECLVATAGVLEDDMQLKTLNIGVLLHSRSEDTRVRLFALTCSEALWRAQGDKLIGFAAETATFIAECAEDSNDSVVREAHRLKNAVESVAGQLEG